MTTISSSEIKYFLAAPGASAGNTTAGTAGNSLGKYVSTTEWTGGSKNDLLLDITGAQNAASQVDYECVFVKNTNSANALQNAVAYLSADVAGGATIAIAVDTTPASDAASSTPQALTATTTTAPGASVTALSYSAPTSAGSGIALGNLAPNAVRAIWIRRTASNSAALSGDGFTLAVTGDSGSL